MRHVRGTLSYNVLSLTAEENDQITEIYDIIWPYVTCS